MRRRQFLQGTVMSGMLLPSFLFNACQPPSPSDKASANQGRSAGDDFPLNELSIRDLQRKMQDGEYTSRALVELYLGRIEAIDDNGVALSAVIELNPDAISIAEALDAERKKGTVRGPLHGIPFLVKDNIDTGDKMMTTAGALALVGNRAAEDAPLVHQLRQAGAVLLGKTNLSEWANFRSTRSSSGWSSRGGQTKNPYNLERNPCGSSSGSGVAVAANLCAFAIGTETNGSISCPSSINGTVGVKPTVGLVSRRGIIPISRTQDTAGPMTRTVGDAAIALSAMASRDSEDPVSLERPAEFPQDYTRFLQPGGLKGKRIGVEKSFLKVHEGVDALLQTAITSMKEQGAEIVEVDYKKLLQPIGENEYLLLKYEFKDGVDKYLAGKQLAVRTLSDVIEWNRNHADKAMPFFQQEILEESAALGGLEDEDYKAALKVVVDTSRRAIDDTLREQNLDALCGPATGPAWCTDLVNGDSFSGYGMGSGAAMAGYPSITVPMGEVHGLPIGLLFLAGAYREDKLFTIAYAYEQVSMKRSAPAFKNIIS
ncbi:MAG: amidase [Bacteroidota bacterium]|nr:amidase [Bacteroidota bacterium]